MRKRKVIKRHFRVRTKVKQKRVNKLKKIFGIFLFFFVLAGILSFVIKNVYSFLFFSEKFEIKNIKVNGLESISEKDFLSCCGVRIKDNLISTYFMELEVKIKNNLPEIKNIKISRKFPDTIEFTVTERKPLAWLIDKNGKQFAIDDESVLFEIKFSTENIPQIEIEENFRKEAIALLRDMKIKKSNLYFQILKLYNIKDRFILLLKDNIKIFWGKHSNSSFEKKL
ncbi:MAG: cell division protein FtsQ/DivIB, partial [Endomicrobiia bacterium]